MRKYKLYFMILILLFLIFIPFKVEAASWKFVWKNTTVDVPLGAPIEDYKNVPKAELYKNDVLLIDTAVTYNTEGDWLYYFKDINTSKLGEYLVWYKAYDSKYSPGTCTGYKTLVKFVVKDTISPDITINNEYYYIKRGSEFDLSSNYNVKDNHGLSEIKESHFIDQTRIGSYPVNIIAKDLSGNQSEASFTAIVYESQAPVITSDCAGNCIEIPLNKEFDIKSHFKAIDSYEGDITSKISYPTIKNDEICEYDYRVSVTNDANLTAYLDIRIKVVDDSTPCLELLTHTLVLDYQTNFDSLNLKKYIKTLTDNTKINEENLSISHNLENKVGKYLIWYSYTDGIFTVEDSIDVSLISYEKPEIVASSIEIPVGANVDLSDFIDVIDKSDSRVKSTLEIYDQNVDYEKEGTYIAEAYCINSSGQSQTASFKVIVKNNDSSFSYLYLWILLGIMIFIVIILLALFIVYVVISKKKNKTII